MRKYKHIVQYYETDRMGITHHSNYIRGMEKADGSLAAEGHSEHCFLDSDGKIIRLDKRFPDFFRTLTELAQANEPQAGGHRL